MKDEQVALLRADVNTGIVLDKNYIYVTKSDQEVYAVFDHIDSAVKFAKSIISERRNIEYEVQIFKVVKQIEELFLAALKYKTGVFFYF